MNRSKSSFLTLLCFILCWSYAVTFDLADLIKLISGNNQGCPAVKTQGNFSLEKMQGNWFIQYQVNPYMSSSPPCQAFEIETTGTDDVKLYLKMRIMKGLVMRGRGFGAAINSDTPARLSLEWEHIPGYTETTVIGETDYDNYAVMLTCSPLGEPNTGFLLMRDEQIQEPFFTQGKEVLEEYFGNATGFLTQNTVGCNLNPIGADEVIVDVGSLDIGDIITKLLSQ